MTNASLILMKKNDLGAKFLTKLRNGRAVVGVLGLGYVGLPLALRFAEAGLRTVGFDIDPRKVRQLKAGRSYINYIPDTAIRSGMKRGMAVTSDFSRARM